MVRKRKKKNTLLIDADILIYKAAVRCEQEICWDEENEIWSLHADLKEAKHEVRDELSKLEEDLGAARVLLAFSSKRTFRHALYPAYKAARRKVRKPVVLGPLRAWAKSQYESIEWPGLEADDVLGVLAKSHTIPADGGSKIVVSDDKDLESVPCYLYKPMKPELGIQRITYPSARLFHLTQTLTGDSTDGFGGCPGVGPKRAEAILKKGTWAEVVEAYESKGLNETEALLQARMAKILTPSLFNQNTNEVTLWNPKKHK
ncbi:MAG: putative ribonuclease H [Prokaryotic dsDNA virus sp.]|nr:MAG: putative ribonuclease H [Prokaryotic dsDNA virus sp.]|tara:strand:+ start:3663 stop:4442 length:780 start_codon:yes stop_codon:yes gene_type:complete